MPRLTIDAIISLLSRVYSVPSISRRLTEENVSVSVHAIYYLADKWRTKGAIKDLHRWKRSCILSEEMRRFIDEELQKNDELTSTKIKEMLGEKWPDVIVSKTTIKRERRQLGWVCTRPHYCQFLREVSIISINNPKISKWGQTKRNGCYTCDSTFNKIAWPNLNLYSTSMKSRATISCT